MNHSKQSTLKLLASLALMAVILPPVGMISPLRADDIDIYRPFAISDNTLNTDPNVLFIIDTSASMLNVVPNSGGQTRLQQVQRSLKQALEDVGENINVGLMRFSQSGGAVIFPVTPISQGRAELIAAIDSLKSKPGSPLAETAYESLRYWRGMAVHWGRSRGDSGSAGRQFARISHPGSWVGGNIINPAGCDWLNRPNAADCAERRIAGAPVYRSPIAQACQNNYNIIISDGMANLDQDSNSDIRDLPQISLAGITFTGNYLDELAAYGLRTDLSAELDGLQFLVTHSVGFGLDQGGERQGNELLQATAYAGGGMFRFVSQLDEILTAVQSVPAQSNDGAQSFLTPVLDVNAQNRLVHGDDIYTVSFQVGPRIGWQGNVKKYRLAQDGTLLDAEGNAATDEAGVLRAGARSFWGVIPDGNEVVAGGAGERVPAWNDGRRVLTNVDSDSPNGDSQALVRLDSLVDDIKALLGDSAMDNDTRDNLLDFIYGKLPFATDNAARWPFFDPLHSPAVPVHYREGNRTYLLVATNGGDLRMLNAESGEELWRYIPQAMLPLQARLYANPVGGHAYGIDGRPSVWRFDGRTYVSIGQRRGGRKIWTLDITQPNIPRLVWRIDGGSGKYQSLGQTWSTPVFAIIAGDSEPRPILAFAGGYHPDQDHNAGNFASDYGNAIFIVDALTGRRLWSVGKTESHRLSHSGMRFPIASDLAVMDADNDGLLDRIYVGDLGGQIWRVDIAPELARSTVVRLASLSEGSATGTRKFFYPPDIARIRGGKFYRLDRYDILAIASGDRADPLSTTTADQVFMVRDDYADSVPNPTGYRAVQHEDLVNISTLEVPENPDESNPVPTEYRQAAGWYMALDSAPGEKSLAAAKILGGQVFLTSYVPDNPTTVTACQASLGSGRVYAMDIATGSAEVNNAGIGIPGSVVAALRDSASTLATPPDDQLPPSCEQDDPDCSADEAGFASSDPCGQIDILLATGNGLAVQPGPKLCLREATSWND